MTTISVQESIQGFLGVVKSTLSENSYLTYGYAMLAFQRFLVTQGISEDGPVEELSDEVVGLFAKSLNELSPATEKLYIHATINYFEYLTNEGLHSPNIPRLRLLLHIHTRNSKRTLPKIYSEEITEVLEYVQNLPHSPAETDAERLRNLRDRAFLLTLADTGLRVHEICKLWRGDIDWNEGRAIIIGKGNMQAVVRFSGRSLTAIKEYLSARSTLDGGSGRALQSLALFARHDKGAGKKIKPITTATGRNIVEERVAQALGDERAGNITPHSFRHYFVTTVLRATGNLKMAQELARHKNISVTQRYAHLSDDELDKGYHEIFK